MIIFFAINNSQGQGQDKTRHSRKTLLNQGFHLHELLHFSVKRLRH